MRFAKILPILAITLMIMIAGCASKTTQTATPAATAPAPAEKPAEQAPQTQEISAPAASETEKTETPTETVVETAPAEESTTPAAETVKTIAIKGFKSYPDDLTITAGTTVRFKNEGDNFLHIIGWNGYPTNAPKMSGMKPGQSWEYTFQESGELTWFSTAHPQTQGKITVTG